MRRRRHKLQVSTFPFLAVLLCAMEALLLVLLVMDRRAHDAARARMQQAARRAAEDAASDADSRRASVQQARDAARAARLRERETEHGRLLSQVAGVQGEIMSVRDQIAEAAARLQAEQSEKNAIKQKIDAEQKKVDSEQQAILQVHGEEAKNAAQSEASHKELAAMTADLAQLERALADLRAAREKEQKTYSVVPYNGKHGENRRPLYVECAGDQLIFHPDRLSLPESRIATDGEAEVRRRLARQKEQLPPAEASAFTPYLMLLVRPDGVVSYYRLREALHGLKIDFGYEFIDADWALDFPADDAAPAAPWMTAAKPPDVAPSTAPPGTPLAGVKPGFGPAASAGGPPSPGPGGISPDGLAHNGADEPPMVAPSPGPGGAARPSGPAAHGSVGVHTGSQFGSLKSEPNGSAAGPVLAEAGTPGAGAASEPGRQGPPAVGAPLPPLPGPPGLAPGSAVGGAGTTNTAPGAARNGGTVAAPAPARPESLPAARPAGRERRTPPRAPSRMASPPRRRPFPVRRAKGLPHRRKRRPGRPRPERPGRPRRQPPRTAPHPRRRLRVPRPRRRRRRTRTRPRRTARRRTIRSFAARRRLCRTPRGRRPRCGRPG